MFFILEKEQLQLLIVVYYKWKELHVRNQMYH